MLRQLVRSLACSQRCTTFGFTTTRFQFLLAKHVRKRLGRRTLDRRRLGIRVWRRRGLGRLCLGLGFDHGRLGLECHNSFGLWLWLGRGLDHRRYHDFGLGLGLDRPLGLGFCHHGRLGRHCVLKRLLDDLFVARLGRIREQFIALHENTLLAHLDLHGPGATSGVGRLDLRGLLARQGDLRFALALAVRATQVLEQTRLVLLAEQVAGVVLVDTSLLELLKQRGGRHLEFAGKLGNAHLVHTAPSVIARTSAHGQR